MSGANPSLVVGLDHDDFLPEAKGNTLDHRNTGSALLDAVGDAGDRRMFPDIAGKSWEHEVCRHGVPAKPTHAVGVSGHLSTAIESLKAHRACLSAPGPAGPDARTLLNAFANQSGQPRQPGIGWGHS